MSTQFTILNSLYYELVLDERSCVFDLDIFTRDDSLAVTSIAAGLTPDEVVDIAMRLIQPTLYNVDDPKAFMEGIKEKLGRLFV